MMNYSKFKKIIDEIENSRAYEIDSESYKLENSFKIMIANFGYLRDVVHLIPTFTVDKRQEKDKFMIEATRCFVNFLNSAGAFRDHTRRYIEKLYGSTDDALDGKYQEKINTDFLNDSLTLFIEGLRNYYCHVEVPPVGIVTRFPDSESKSNFVVLLKDIDVNNHPKTKQFIETRDGEDVDVLELSEKYVYKTLFPWIMKEQGKIHKEEFEKLEILKQKARVLMEDR